MQNSDGTFFDLEPSKNYIGWFEAFVIFLTDLVEGESNFVISDIAEKWGWDELRVIDFLSALACEGRINIISEQDNSTIIVRLNKGDGSNQGDIFVRFLTDFIEGESNFVITDIAERYGWDNSEVVSVLSALACAGRIDIISEQDNSTIIARLNKGDGSNQVIEVKHNRSKRRKFKEKQGEKS